MCTAATNGISYMTSTIVHSLHQSFHHEPLQLVQR